MCTAYFFKYSNDTQQKQSNLIIKFSEVLKMANELLSMAQQFSGLPMENLIGGPLMAAAEANGKMAVTQTKFILDTCFSKKEDNQTKVCHYEPIMITMKLVRNVIVPGDTTAQPPEDVSIKEFETSFQLPLLTVMPLNSLAVDQVDIGFDMEVKSSYSEATNDKTENKLSTEASFEAKYGLGMFSVSVKGNVSYDQSSSSSRDTHYEKSNSAHYNVKVHAGQLPLPTGVTTIIDAFSKSIQPIEIPKQKP